MQDVIQRGVEDAVVLLSYVGWEWAALQVLPGAAAGVATRSDGTRELCVPVLGWTE